MKRILACLCASALAVGLSACGDHSATEEATYSDAVLTGQVQAVTADTLTLLLGELTTDQANANDMGRPDGDGQQPPALHQEKAEEKENGEESVSMPNGVPTGGELEPPPDGKMDAIGFDATTTFIAGEESVTLTVAQDALDALSDIAPDDVVQVETNETGEIVTISVIDLDSGFGGPPDGGAGTIEQGTAAFTIAVDGDYRSETYTSTGDDENALRVEGAAVTLDGITVEKSAGSSSNVESGDFYGMNAALLATDGAEVTLTNAHVSSSAQNGNGVFSYGEGTVVTISDSVIETFADNSGGIQTTGGGTTNASNLTVTTQGSSSAAIRSDRGGGTVNVDGGTYTSNGLNSPAIYSTADITVRDAVLTAENSEALVIEGENSIDLTNCDVSGNMSDTQGSSSDINVHNVMIYQSMSGDAEVGTSNFTMTGGTLTGNSGDMIYVTNTNSVIRLTDVELINNDADGALLRITGNDASHGWGTAGSNGAQVTMIATDQALEGAILVDTISTLDLTLDGSSEFVGTIQIIENEEGGTAVEHNAVVTIGSGSTWTLTGDCTISSLDNQGTINFNGYTITLADGTVLNA